jgi:hypothetical protein
MLIQALYCKYKYKVLQMNKNGKITYLPTHSKNDESRDSKQTFL